MAGVLVLVALPVVHAALPGLVSGISHLHQASLFGLKCLKWHLPQIDGLVSAEKHLRKNILAAASQAVGG